MAHRRLAVPALTALLLAGSASIADAQTGPTPRLGGSAADGGTRSTTAGAGAADRASGGSAMGTGARPADREDEIEQTGTIGGRDAAPARPASPAKSERCPPGLEVQVGCAPKPARRLRPLPEDAR